MKVEWLQYSDHQEKWLHVPPEQVTIIDVRLLINGADVDIAPYVTMLIEVLERGKNENFKNRIARFFRNFIRLSNKKS
jgi:hypothetical protein